eukprot:TRINITY_DN1828_c0_g1_i2.p1 TRINITY_DN1828_c0_g1~~TRINITY_DN1828_c0_g1_i2.p1  ORF type:complete len:213 (+),score=37.17 TRINITY_DN1828_c0_g1_i2:957-1595(+)
MYQSLFEPNHEAYKTKPWLRMWPVPDRPDDLSFAKVCHQHQLLFTIHRQFLECAPPPWADAAQSAFQICPLVFNRYTHTLGRNGRAKVPLTEAHLAAAKARLDAFEIVLLLEYVDETLPHFAETLGWDSFPRQAAATKPEELSAERPPRSRAAEELSPVNYARLVSLCRLDMDIYEHARRLLVQQLQARGVEVELGDFPVFDQAAVRERLGG